MLIRFIKYLTLTLTLFILISCKTTQTSTTPCYSKYIKNLVIRWGEYNDSVKISKGFQLNSDGTLYEAISDSLQKNYKLKLIDTIQSEKYCRIMKMVRDTIIRYQALFEPGDTLRFIEFINHDTKTYTRAVWNPTFSTYGSRGFRAVYDSIYAILPKMK